MKKRIIRSISSNDSTHSLGKMKQHISGRLRYAKFEQKQIEAQHLMVVLNRRNVFLLNILLIDSRDQNTDF